MDFADAFKAAKSGQVIDRPVWYAHKIRMFRQADPHQMSVPLCKAIDAYGMALSEFLEPISEENMASLYLPSVEDLAAEDWRIVR